MAAEGYRLTISLSDFATRKLIAWSKAHDKSKTGFAALIVETAIENNLDLINSLTRDIAAHEGIDPHALEQRWLKDEKYSPKKNKPNSER